MEAMIRKVKMDTYVDCSVIYNVCAMTIDPLVKLSRGESYILFFSFSTCDQIDDIGRSTGKTVS